jgi:hypothetical protein
VTAEARILLATAANLDAAGQVNALGLGWEIIGPSPLPAFVVIVSVKPSRGRGEEPVDVQLRLLDGAGNPVVLEGQGTPQTLDVRFQAEAGPTTARPVGLRGGTTLIFQIGPGILLDPGMYEWVVSVEDESQPHWRQPFYVRAKPDEFPVRFQAEEVPPPESSL